MRGRAAGFLSLVIRATWNGAVVAESEETVVVEGNHYFPPVAVDCRYLRDSDTHTRCPWKGTASYYSLVVDGKENLDAAWYYPEPNRAARHIAGRIAFWRGVDVGHVADSAATGEHDVPGRNRGLMARLLRR